MLEIFISNFIALATMLIISVIIVAIFIGTLYLTFKYINFCFEHIENHYLRLFVICIMSPLILALLVSFVLGIFGVSIIS